MDYCRAIAAPDVGVEGAALVGLLRGFVGCRCDVVPLVHTAVLAGGVPPEQDGSGVGAEYDSGPCPSIPAVYRLPVR